LFVYDPKSDTLYLDYTADYHVRILERIMEKEKMSPHDRFIYNTDFIFGAVRSDGLVTFYTGLDNPEAQKRINELLESTQKEGAVPELV